MTYETKPKLNVTHAVAINAPAAEVWPWLVQMGQGRGGFYSYEFIENARGLDIYNANRILPEFQNLKVGNSIPLAPNGAMDMPVVVLEPEKTLVMHGDTRKGEAPKAFKLPPNEFFATTWGFYLDDKPGATRLIERFRMDYSPTLPNAIFYNAFLEPGAFVMERKMLLTIKERAERQRQLEAMEASSQIALEVGETLPEIVHIA